MEKSFLVIGTGEVGIAMLDSLYKYREANSQHFKIGALVQPLHAVIGSGPDLRFADLTIEAVDLVAESIENLANVFRKYDTVICCSGFSIGAGMQLKITKAVLEAGVRRYVPWQFGADYDKIGRGSAQPVFDEQLDVRDLLRAQSKTHWIIVSTGMITSFLFREDFGVINLSQQVIHALGDWQNSLTLTACEDIGALTVEVLFHQPEILDQVVFVSGDTVTFEEIADKMEEVFDVKFERVLWDYQFLEKKLNDEPDNIFNKYRLVFTHPGVTWPMEVTFNDLNNIPTTGIVEWAKAHVTS
ncbi:aromatic alcohol reductase [Pedobacter sp. MR2016-24]|uniref:aromatic alcohol reductase n=1 Tax=Pedobacter sp. MR2016-24 TaxID=2994466 RepID=UPI0022463C0A|nr:aromatic alcohol reductase [Pedobacter sp. MR2016-24]MCX2485737.1 aromatic alcohol reductase [Pedobacter sp. MR2016-24]